MQRDEVQCTASQKSLRKKARRTEEIPRRVGLPIQGMEGNIGISKKKEVTIREKCKEKRSDVPQAKRVYARKDDGSLFKGCGA